jgi:hypothetical protein
MTIVPATMQPRLLVVAMACLACAPEAPRDALNQPADAIRSVTLPDSVVRLGVALRDADGRWCVTFAGEGRGARLEVGDTVTLVWTDSSAWSASVTGRVQSVRDTPCVGAAPGATVGRDANAAPRQVVYHLTVRDSVPDAAASVAHAVAGTSVWRFGPDDTAVGDIDGDGIEEVLRACTSLEGLHLTMWRGPLTRVAHYYHYLGYDVEPSCTEAETLEVPEDSGGPAI